MSGQQSRANNAVTVTEKNQEKREGVADKAIPLKKRGYYCEYKSAEKK